MTHISVLTYHCSKITFTPSKLSGDTKSEVLSRWPCIPRKFRNILRTFSASNSAIKIRTLIPNSKIRRYIQNKKVPTVAIFSLLVIFSLLSKVSYISNSNWTEWSTIRTSAKLKVNLKLRARLLPELYKINRIYNKFRN